MLDQLETKAASGADDSTQNALRDEAMAPSNKSLETQPTAAGAKAPTTENATASGDTAKPALSPNEQRKADETKFFKELYEKSNMELDPFKPGEGPFQSLQHMKEEGKIQMTPEEMVAEAKRIQVRDAKALGRSFYKTSDHIKLWSDEEIKKLVEAQVEKVKGIDVSNWQKTVDWKQVKDAGYQFAIMKATEGNFFVDKTFDTFRKGAREAGLKTGYYHYFHPEQSVTEQVNLFCKVVGKAEPDSLRLVIDAEDPAQWRGYTLEQRVKMVDNFLQGVKTKLGETPKLSVYCSPNFANEILGNSPVLSKYSLWIANYGVNQPTLPRPWAKWDFWQYTDTGRVPGINGNVDLNVFNGTDLSQDQVKTNNQKS